MYYINIEGSATSYKFCNHSWKSFISLKILNLHFQIIPYIYRIFLFLHTLKQEYNENILFTVYSDFLKM